MIAFVVDCLASWRLTHLIVEDQFPPIAEARDRTLERFGPDHPVSYLITCSYCTGVWAAAAVTLGLARGRRRRLAYLLAAAAAPPIIEAAVIRLEGK